jgi:hypothetical protein
VVVLDEVVERVILVKSEKSKLYQCVGCSDDDDMLNDVGTPLYTPQHDRKALGTT